MEYKFIRTSVKSFVLTLLKKSDMFMETKLRAVKQGLEDAIMELEKARANND